MEQFDRLESRVLALLQELEALKSRELALQEEVSVLHEEVSALRGTADKYATLQQEHQDLHAAVKAFEDAHTINETLRRVLGQERSVREVVEKRIDVLLARIQQAMDSE